MKGLPILDLGFWILDWAAQARDRAGAEAVGKIQHPKSRQGSPSGLATKIQNLSLVAIFLLSSTLAAQQRQAELSWWDRAQEKQIGHYWIKTDLPADEANALARHLNFMYGEYARRLANMPVRAEEKLNVLIFRRAADYLLTLRARFGVDGQGTGGMFFVMPAGAALAFWTEDLPRRRIDHVVQHEGFHQFAYSRFGDDLPIWVNEGLAEFFGEAVVVGDALVIGQSTPRVINDVKNAIEKNTHIPFGTMLNMTPQQWSSAIQKNQAALNYHQSWSMVHFLVYGDGGKYVDAFEVYLKHLNNGLPSREAFIRAFGDDVPGFEKQWKDFALAARPSAFVTALERIEFLAEGLLELSRRQIHPSTLEDLRAQLVEIQFAHTIKTHGNEVRLAADDASLYQIPMDDLCLEQPSFVLSKPNPHRLPQRERRLEEVNPTPATVATDNLRPRGLELRWIRDLQENEWSYQIAVR